MNSKKLFASTRYRAFFQGLLVVCCTFCPDVLAVMVETQSGVVQGESDDGVSVFRGIPYAAPPTGSLRWRAPQPPEPWQGVKDAREFGLACLQPSRPGRRLKLEQSEDCLTLNIWAPEEADKPLPVMVWIHGGAFRLGAGSIPFYDGTALARKKVILVTFNYRLGRFGFFSHPQLTRERNENYPQELLANYGLMDQLLVLQWVKNNIAAFGGDADNVTIFGESAGGVSVNTLMASPLTKGLFHRAISESGGGFGRAQLIDRPRDNKPALVRQGELWATTTGIKPITPEALRALPASVVLGEDKLRHLGFGPVIDGQLVVDDIGVRFAQGKIQPVPYLVGANNYEASLMKATKMSAQQVFKTLGNDFKRAKSIYAKTSITEPEPLAQQIYGDALFVAPARYMADGAAGMGLPVWSYHFSYVPEKIRGKKPGASHGSEIPFVFGSLDNMPASRWWLSAGDKLLSQQMMDYWVHFAVNGNPNCNSCRLWPQYSEDKPNTLMFNNEGVDVVLNLYRERLDFHQYRYESAVKTSKEQTVGQLGK